MATNPIIASVPDNASAVVSEMDTVVNFATDGAKILSVKNAGSEVFSVNKDGVISGNGYLVTVTPDQGGAGIESALNAVAAAGGGIVQLVEGTYDITSTILISNIANVSLQGVGPATVLQSNLSAGPQQSGLLDLRVGSTALRNINNYTKGDTSIFTTTAADATAYGVGDLVRIFGNDANGDHTVELNRVKTAGNGGTGEVELENSLAYTMTSVTSFPYNPINCRIADFKVVQIGAGNHTGAILLNTPGENVIIENIVFDNIKGESIRLSSDRSVIRNILINAVDHDPVVAPSCINVNGSQVTIQNVNVFGIADDTVDAMHLNELQNSVVENCTIAGKFAKGMEFNAISGANCRNIIVRNNRISGAQNMAMEFAGTTEALVAHNYMTEILDAVSSFGIRADGIKRSTFIGNTIVNGQAGLSLTNACEDVTIICNYFKDNGQFAIQANASTKNVTIAGNTVNGAVSEGIDVVNNSFNVSITGNVVFGGGNDGISFRDGDVCTAHGNTCHTNTDQGLRIATASNDILAVGNNCSGDGIANGTGSGNILGLNKE